MTRLSASFVVTFCLASAWAAGCSSSSNKPTTSGSGGSTSTGDTGGSSNAGNTSTDAGGVPADADVSVHTIDPTDTDHLLYMGRIDFTDPTKPVLWSSGAVVSAWFTGTAVSVMFKDGSATTSGQNYYEAVIDQDPTTALMITPKGSQTTYPAFSNLPYGKHRIELAKRTESSSGPGTFLGFDVNGVPLPAEKPTRKIEAIGDSITAASGVEPGPSSVNCSNGSYAQDAYFSYAAVLARNLNAEYTIVAAGGRGVMDNYECGSTDTLPAGYDHMNQRDLTSALWDHTKYVPDAVIIGLGTNDFSPDQCDKPPISPACDPVKFQKFIEDYEAFVTRLRGYYPNAHIFLTSSPMLTDNWPTTPVTLDSGVSCPYTSRTSQEEAITAVVKSFTDAGDSKVHLVLSIPKGLGRGCGTHPNVNEQMEIGGTPDSFNPSPQSMLLTPVKTAMGW